MASTFNLSSGFPLGISNRNYVYLYGLSDFWSLIFENSASINLMVEAESLSESEIYSNFLQLTTGISLDQLEVYSNSQFKLLIISEESSLDGFTYTLAEKVASTKYLSNRLLLPTKVLEENVDYALSNDGSSIKFAKRLSSYGFPSRLLPDGITKEYALWGVDINLDKNWVYSKYAKLLNIPSPSISTEQFKAFVYGMFYLFCNGPTLSLIRKGLNLALGIPLAREAETVLEIREYLNTGNTIVITDNDSYTIPYGLPASVSVGEILSTGQELSSWIELKDYKQDGEWWLNFRLPPTILPYSEDRYILEGSELDRIMKQYLAAHTFFVNVKTLNFKNVQVFEDLASIIQEVKPTYTTPVYVWTVGIEDSLGLDDSLFSIIPSMLFEDTIFSDAEFWRGTDRPYSRGPETFFSRMSAPTFAKNIAYLPTDLSFNGEPLTGFTAPQTQYRTLTDREKGWVRALCTRTSGQFPMRRTLANFAKRIEPGSDGIGYDNLYEFLQSKRLVFLYNTMLTEFIGRCSSIPGVNIPSSIISNSAYLTIININANILKSDTGFTLMSPPGTFTGLSNVPEWLLSGDTANTWAPPQSDIMSEDFLVTAYIDSNSIGVFWATSNYTCEAPVCWEIFEPDRTTIRITGPLDMSDSFQANPVKILMGAAPPLGQTVYSDAENSSLTLNLNSPVFTKTYNI